MAAQKPGIPKGTRDFSPEIMVKRNYIFDKIKEVFNLYGYQPIETPAMENLSTLLGKYGEEGDRLLFQILNSGNFTNKLNPGDLEELSPALISSKICERGLRYDLTVPFARYVVQHRNDIVFPFKRYQIQPVWRGDNPQKGRYREFYQCDADVIGSNSLLNEVELVQIIDEVFKRLSVNVTIKINSRKILAGISEYIGESGKITDITVAIDKIDKIGIEKVNVELQEKGLSDKAIKKLQPILQLSGSAENKIKQLEELIKDSENGKKGLEEISTIFNSLNDIGIVNAVDVDITLARGLNYYTGAIIEVKANDFEIGSICGGGRYDNLTGIFGLPDVSGVGISFGADRIFDVMEGMDLFPEETIVTSKILFINFGEKEEKYCLQIINNIRKAGISCEIYPESSKMKKQMAYANRKNIPFVALVGEDEIAGNTITVKDMTLGEQNKMTLEELIEMLK